MRPLFSLRFLRLGCGLAGLAGLAACHPVLPPVPLHVAPRPPPAPPAPEGPPVFVPQRFLAVDRPAWSPDGRTLVTTMGSQRVLVADADTGFVRGAWDGAFIQAIPSWSNGELHDMTLHGLRFGRTVLREGRRVETPAFPVDPGTWMIGLSGSPRGDLAYIGSATKGVFIETATGKVRDVWPESSGPRRAVISPDSTAFALLLPHRFGVIEPDGKARWSAPERKDWIVQLDWSHDGTLLALRSEREIELLAAGDGQTVARRNPCEHGAPTKMAVSPSGTELVVACTGRKPTGYTEPDEYSLVVLDGHLEERQRFVALPSPPLELRYSPDGRRVGDIHARGSITVVEIGSPRPMTAPSPCHRSPCSASWSPDFDRIAVRADGDLGYVIHDLTGPRRVRLGSSGQTPRARAEGEAPRPPPPRLDERPAPRFEQRPGDGPCAIRDSSTNRILKLESVELCERAGVLALTPDQRFALALLPADEQGVPVTRLLVWETATGKLRPRMVARWPILRWDVAPDGHHMAVVQQAPQPPGQAACALADEAPCQGLQLFDLDTGKRVLAAPPRAERGADDGFSADGRMLLLGDVLESDTGKVLFSLDRAVHGRARWLGKTARLLILRADTLALLDPRSGAVGPSAQGITSVVDMSPDGAAVLVTTEAGDALFDTATGALRPLPPHPAGHRARAFLRDGRFVRCEAGGRPPAGMGVSVLRLADARLLAWEGALAVSDEGVFDGPPEAWSEGAFRLGPDVLRSRMVPLSELASRFHRPGLIDAFFSGAPVSPAPGG